MRTVFALTLLLMTSTAAADDAPSFPAEGSAAPEFALLNGAGRKVSLDQYRGKWVVLYFYPQDFTSGCTIEARNFQRDLDKYTAANAVVLGVSVDSVDSHKEFCSKEALSFNLLADSDRSVSTKYGSLLEREGKSYSARNTFLIDPAGVIRRVYVKVKPAEHSEQVLAGLAALQKSRT